MKKTAWFAISLTMIPISNNNWIILVGFVLDMDRDRLCSVRYPANPINSLMLFIKKLWSKALGEQVLFTDPH